MKHFFIIFFFLININFSYSAQKDKAYFAGGCFWCVDFEVVERIYDKKIISFKELLENFWNNIDPFDAYGQFCDKGYSYRSVAFYQNDEEKKLIEKDIKDLQNKFNKKVVTYVRNFEKFYKAEEYHKDFYKIKLERNLRYKKACGREELLKRIWSQ